MKRSLITFLGLLFITSCSVKEHRVNCPCYAYVNIDEFLEAGFHDAIVSFSSGDLLYRNKVRLAPYEGCGFEQEMPRRLGKNAIIGGIKNSQISRDSLLTPYGLECDPIWLYSQNIDCIDKDRVFVEAVPLKQYCKLNIIVDGIDEDEEQKMGFRITALCNGLDLYSMSVLEGGYSAIAKQSSKYLYNVRIPRQKTNVLTLEILEYSSEDKDIEGVDAKASDELGAKPKVNYSVKLGELFKQSGYDWNSPNLMDMSILIDYSNPILKIEIGNWMDNSNYYDTEI